MKRNTIEAVLGAVVLAIAAIFLIFAYRMADLRASSGYQVLAAFDKLGGVKMGSDVRISGIKVGTVSDLKLDPESFRALTMLTVENNIKLPVDTIAEISSEGLLGGNYVSLIPGNQDEIISTDGRGRILQTQGPVDLVQLLGRFIFSTADKESKDNVAASSPAPLAKPLETAPVSPTP
ncbi:MAG: outer membrane lipid asymmetry maintenance protein MlaD [Dongiaceae bacterium]